MLHRSSIEIEHVEPAPARERQLSKARRSRNARIPGVDDPDQMSHTGPEHDSILGAGGHRRQLCRVQKAGCPGWESQVAGSELSQVVRGVTEPGIGPWVSELDHEHGLRGGEVTANGISVGDDHRLGFSQPAHRVAPEPIAIPRPEIRELSLDPPSAGSDLRYAAGS